MDTILPGFSLFSFKGHRIATGKKRYFPISEKKKRDLPMRLNWSFLSQSHSIWGRTTNKALIWKGLKQSSLANLEFPGAWSYDFSLWSGRNWSYPGIVLAVGPVPNSTNRIVNYSKCLSFTNSKQNINVCNLDKYILQFLQIHWSTWTNTFCKK